MIIKSSIWLRNDAICMRDKEFNIVQLLLMKRLDQAII